jgi:hypothetical protein
VELGAQHIGLEPESIFIIISCGFKISEKEKMDYMLYELNIAGIRPYIIVFNLANWIRIPQTSASKKINRCHGNVI